MLNWRTITPSRSPAFLVRGTELSVAIVPDTLSRFQICEIRTAYRGDDGMEYDREYVLRDAATVSDADVKAGVRPKVVGSRYASEPEAIAAALRLCGGVLDGINDIH